MRGLRASTALEEARAAGTDAGERAQRHHDGPARRRGADLGGGHQLRAALRAAARGGGPGAGALGDRVDLGPEADRARHRALRHDPAWTTSRSPTPTCRRARGVARAGAGALRRRRARGHHALPHPQVPAARPRSAAPRAAAAAAGAHPGQRLLVRGCAGAPAADPALHVVRHAAPPAAAGLRDRAARSSGTRSSRAAGAPCTPTSWCTTRRCPRSSTRCRSAWSSWRRGPASWPTSGASSRTTSTVGMALRAEFVDFDEELSLPVFVPAGAGAGAAAEGSLMDFHFSDEQLAVSEAATGVFAGLVDPERIADGRGERRPHRPRRCGRRWPTPTCSGLAVPEAEGGAGYGLMELCLLLEAQGNAVAPVPLWATLVLGALPIAHFGSEAQRARWLPGVVSGDVILTAALTGSAASPTSTPRPCAPTRRRRRLGARGHRAGRAPGAPGGPHRRAGPHRGRRRAAGARRPAGGRASRSSGR